MSRTAARPRLSRDARRRAILDAGLEIFASSGYEGASMRAIAARAGVTTPVVYDHFQSKAALHTDLLREQAHALRATAIRPFEASSAEDFMRQTFDAFFGFVEAHRFAWRMLFRDPPAAPQVASVHAQIMREATQAIADLFRLTPLWNVTADLTVEQASTLLAEVTKSALNGLASWWWDHPSVPRDHLVALAMDALWTGMERLQETPANGHGRNA